MIVDEKPCSSKELKSLYCYLMNTPVANFVQQLYDSGCVRAHHAKITSLKELGNQHLIWSNLGGLIRRPKFEVREAYEALKITKDKGLHSECNWDTVNRYLELLSKDILELRITVADKKVTGFPFNIIIDGCKRTTAFYEHHLRLSKEEVEFNFIIFGC